MTRKTKHFTLKKIIAFIIIIATLISAGISTFYLLFSGEDVQSVEGTFATAGGSVTLGDLDGTNTSELYYMSSPDGSIYYCANPNYASSRRLKNSKQVDKSPVAPDGGYSATEQETTYTQLRSGQLPQTVAYAKWQGAEEETMQNIVWASWNWDDGYELLTGHDTTSNNVNSGGIAGRSERFANFVNYVLTDGTTFTLSATPTTDESDDLKVMIDQANTTYTVGPYVIDFANSSSTTRDGLMTLGDLVYDEIVNDYDGKFIWGDIGANIVTPDGNSNTTADIKVLDSSGSEISSKFPKFGQEFYIQYTSSDKITKIVPSLAINFVTKITGTGTTYQSSQCEFRIHDDATMQYLTAAMREYKYAKKYDIEDGLFTNVNSLNITGETTDVASIFSDIKTSIATNIKKYAEEGDYPVGSVEVDIGEEGSGHILGIFSDEDNTFHKGNISIGTQLVKVDEKKAYLLNNNDGTPTWWDDNIPSGFLDNPQNSIDDERTYTIYKNYGQVRSDDGTILNDLDSEDDGEGQPTEEYCPNADAVFNQLYPGIPSEPSTSASDLAKNWAKYNLRYAIKFAAEYPVVKEENKYLQPAVTVSVSSPSTPSTPDIPSIPSTPGTPYPPVTPGITTSTGSTKVILPGKSINMYIGGYVWEDLGFTKDSEINGQFDSNDESKYGGIQVTLHDKNTEQVVATTTTNRNGQYGFKDLHPMHKYCVEFRYNGQVYQHTYYNNNLSGGYSTATEESNDRTDLNTRFETIDSTPNNYAADDRQNKSYGMYVRIPASDGTYLSYTLTVYTDGQNAGALRFCDVLEIFRKANVNGKNIDSSNQDTMESTYNTLSTDRTYASSEGSFKEQLRTIAINQGKTISEPELNSLWNYINHCMISSYTERYPEQDRFVLEDVDNPQEGNVIGYEYLYIPSRDQSRNVDFGINERDTADLAIQKDVYKATVRVNGKTQTYEYSNKDLDENGNWEITIKNADGTYSGGRYENGLFNGTTKYTREIRKSEYLYDGTIYDSNGENATARDLKVYVTYRITIRNQSQSYDTVVNEVVDYFDESEYTFDGTLQNGTYGINQYSDFEVPRVNGGTYTGTSYIGDRDGNYVADLTVSPRSSLDNNRNPANTDIGHGYSEPLYLSGIVRPENNETSNRLQAGGGMAYIYLTFEVKQHQDENYMDGRIQMDIDVSTENGNAKGVGKQNIAEINSYSTYYRSGAKIPNSDNSSGDRDVGGTVAGSVDRDSSVGNLTSQDLEYENNDGIEDGRLIITNDPVTNRAEDDTDQAPNIRLVFPLNDNEERVATGYVYEDIRDTSSGQAMVGDGKYSDTEQDSTGNTDTKINGVTVQLVELVQDVDSNGIPTGNYLGEYVWGARRWNGETWEYISSNNNNEEIINYDSSESINKIRFYSGQGAVEGTTISPIISGVEGTITAVSGAEATKQGQYVFKAMPAGDFFIRFIYGDTTQTTLTTTADNADGSEVAKFLTNNSTQDYENGYISTSGLNLKSYNGQDYKSTTYQVGIDQNGIGSYNGINGYIDYEKQNYHINSQTGYNEFNSSDGNTTDNDRHGKEVMYYYHTEQSEAHPDISDAKDVGNVRDNVNNYGRGLTGIDGESTQTLVNGRSEVLTSGIKLASTEELADGATTSVEKQIAMIKELMTNTAMTAQTGVINVEVEHNRKSTGGQGTNNSNPYTLRDIDLGLSERPVAQLQMNKEVSNVRITLQNGTILFDTNRQVTNMSYPEHLGHTITYNPSDPNGSAYRLVGYEIANNTVRPELITTYMDEELMYGARIEVDYTFTVTNVGEVDYLDKKFYYTGQEDNPKVLANISTTTANTVVDYITNNMQFLPTNSSNSTWSIRTVNELTSDPKTENTDYTTNPVGNNDDLINNKYYETLNTYNTIVTNKSMGDTALYPEKLVVEGRQSSTQTTMMLSTTLTPDSGEDTMVYNNLSEIVQVSNSQGRRLKWSVTGNQPMADQDSGPDITVDEDDGIYTNVDRVTPTEIDADSSQEILILPPTGANRNYTLWIIVGIVALAIIAGGIVLIRKYFKKK